MTFDVTTHSLVPKHIKISDKEIEGILKKYNISKRQLPRISKKDPAIKEMKLKAGDIVKIKRKSPTSKDSYFYRVVVNV